MNIIFNPLSNNALTESQLKGNDDIIFDLSGNNIFAKGVKFYGTDTHVEILDVLNSDRTDAALSANMGRILELSKVPYNNILAQTNIPGQMGTIVCPTNKTIQGSTLNLPTDNGILFRTNTGDICDLWIGSDDNYIWKRQYNQQWIKIGAGYADQVEWDNVLNKPNKLANPESLIIFDIHYDGSKQITITPNNYIYKVAKANVNTNPITSNTAFIGTYYNGTSTIDSITNTPYRYSVGDIWNYLEIQLDTWYNKKDSKVNAILWGNNFTGSENISDSIYLEDGTQIFIDNTEIIDYSGTTLYLGYGTKNKSTNNTYLYAGNTLNLTIGNSGKVNINSTGVNIYPSLYAYDTANISGGLYLANYKIGTLNESVQSYTDPWSSSGADFRFSGHIAANKIYAAQGFYHPDYNSSTGQTYLLTANGGTATLNYIRAGVCVRQDSTNTTKYPLTWADEANSNTNYNTYLYKSYDKLTYKPSTNSLYLNNKNSMWIGGMTDAAINTYGSGYYAWINGDTYSGRVSIGSFVDNTYDGQLFFTYATTANVNAFNNTVSNTIKFNVINGSISAASYSGYSYTATGGYHLQRAGVDVDNAVLSTNGSYYNVTSGTHASQPYGCIPIINYSDGVMEIGKYLDFHNTNNAIDFSSRLQTDGDYGNVVLMPKKSGRLLVESDLEEASNMYETIVNLHPSNYIWNESKKIYEHDYYYDENTWYPIEIQLGIAGKANYSVVRGEILAYLDTGYTNNSGNWIQVGKSNCSWMTHANGFSSRIIFETQASGWGTVPNNILRILDANQAWCKVNPVRYMVQDYQSSSVVVWCRGYGQYRFRFNYPKVKVVVHTSSFTLGNNSTYSTYSASSYINDTSSSYFQDTYDALNDRLPEIKPTLGYFADVPITTLSQEWSTGAHVYTITAKNMFRSTGNTGWYNETYQDGIVMRQSNWIETWAGANIYTSGAFASSKLHLGSGKPTSLSDYDLYVSTPNGSKFNGTIYTTYTAIGKTPSINFRGGTSTSWDSWCSHQNGGNEALLFATNNQNTAIMFANNINYANISSTQFYDITAPLRIQNNKVWMGYSYSSSPTSNYTLNIKGGSIIDNIKIQDNYIDSNAIYFRDSSSNLIMSLGNNYISSQVPLHIYDGLSIQPYVINDLTGFDAVISINGTAYNITYVDNTHTRACILVANNSDNKQAVSLGMGYDGQILFIKDAGNGIFYTHFRVRLLTADKSTSFINAGTLNTRFDDGKSRILMYSANLNAWIEFYCG